MCSFDPVPIFVPRLGQDLSRNAFVVSCPCVLEQVLSRERFLHDTDNVHFFNFGDFSQNRLVRFDREAFENAGGALRRSTLAQEGFRMA